MNKHIDNRPRIVLQRLLNDDDAEAMFGAHAALYASFDGDDFLEIDGKRVDDPNNDHRVRARPEPRFVGDLWFSGATIGFSLDFARKPSLDDLRADLIGQIKGRKPL